MEFVIFAACALAIALAGPLLVDAVEGVAEETGLGRLWLGTVLLAGATSLPELVSVVTAAGIDEPDIAVGTVLGSNLFNMTIFGAVLVLFPLAVRSNRGGALTGALAITLGAAALVFLLLEGPAVGRFGMGALLLGGLYVAGSFGLFRAERSGRPRAAELPGSAGLSRVRVAAQWTSMRGDVARLAVATAVVFVASLFLPDAAEEIAATLGVSGGVVGVVGVALATSLPEVVTSTVALRRGAPELVVGNVFGSNVFNLAALFAAEAALEEGRLLQVVDGDQAVTAAFGLGVMVLALGPLLRTPGVQRRRRWFRLLGVAILLGYVSGVVTAVSLGVETG